MPITDRLFTKWADGSKLPGKIFTPKNLAPNEKCALIIFLHGVGEAGDGTLANLWKVTSNPDAAGPITFAEQTDDFAFTNPSTGAVKKFIVISLQGVNSWAPFAVEVQNALTMDILKNYPIDTNAIFITGLSAGGCETANAITFGNAALFAAAVPFSQAGQGQDLNLTVKNNIKVWAFAGDYDGGYTVNATQFVQKLNALKPGIAKLTLYPGGHGGWSVRYNPTFKEPWIVNGTQRMLNIYEWLLMNSKNSEVVDGLPGIEEKPPVVEQPVPPAGLKVVVPPAATIAKGTSTFILNGTGSVGVGGWWEQISGPSKTWFTGYNKDNFSVTVNGLVNGDYVFKLTVQTKEDQRVSALQKVSVGGSASTPQKTIVSYLVTPVFSDGTQDAVKTLKPGEILPV